MYVASDAGKAARAQYIASDKGKAARKGQRARYFASDKGKATRARYVASDKGKATIKKIQQAACDRKNQEYKEARAEAKRQLAQLPPGLRKIVIAREKAVKVANSRNWGGSMIFAKAVCYNLAERFPQYVDIFAPQPLMNHEGEKGKNWMQVKAAGGFLTHATDVAPGKLDLVDGRRYRLEPRDKNARGIKYYEHVYFAGSNHPANALQFVEAKKGMLARAHYPNYSVYLYVVDKTHWQYKDIGQTFSWSGVIKSCMRYFARCREPVDVSPTTRGVSVFRVYWKAGAPMVPYVDKLY